MHNFQIRINIVTGNGRKIKNKNHVVFSMRKKLLNVLSVLLFHVAHPSLFIMICDLEHPCHVITLLVELSNILALLFSYCLE